jgi:UDP-N-acetylmuramyl tripeptide synthase
VEVRDSRRLTGPNILWRRPGAVLDVRVDDGDDGERAVAQWRRQARRILDGVGWHDEGLADRRFHGGVSLALSAPIDALYAATEVAEWAWEAAAAALRGEPGPDYDEAVARLRVLIAEESNPAVLALQRAAAERRVAFLWDDDEVSVGMGTGSLSWAAAAVPDPSAVDWDAVHDVPAALVTGTNGKTTTVRLLRSIAAAAGLEPGISSTDGCWVAGEEIGEGDYSGPGGARLVLRDRRVEVAILETARGGMLRRGLAVERADVAIITNVAEDHLGEWGIHDLDELVATKFIVARGTRHLVLNADDPRLCSHPDRAGVRRIWFSRRYEPSEIEANVATGRETCVLQGDELVLFGAAGREVVASLDEAPMTFGGAAAHNVANALGAICVARRLGLPLAAIRAGLCSFDSSAEENPGRLNRFDLGGVTAIVDFAHNPHGLEAVLYMARALPARRRCVVVGQAGDRDDEAIRELARLIWKSRPDRVVVKELVLHLRGREPGEVPAIIVDELRRLGAPEDAIDVAGSELDAVRRALGWSRPGDLLLLLSHEERVLVLGLVRELGERGWKPGQALPI